MAWSPHCLRPSQPGGCPVLHCSVRREAETRKWLGPRWPPPLQSPRPRSSANTDDFVKPVLGIPIRPFVFHELLYPLETDERIIYMLRRTLTYQRLHFLFDFLIGRLFRKLILCSAGFTDVQEVLQIPMLYIRKSSGQLTINYPFRQDTWLCYYS